MLRSDSTPWIGFEGGLFQAKVARSGWLISPGSSGLFIHKILNKRINIIQINNRLLLKRKLLIGIPELAQQAVDEEH